MGDRRFWHLYVAMGLGTCLDLVKTIVGETISVDPAHLECVHARYTREGEYVFRYRTNTNV